MKPSPVFAFPLKEKCFNLLGKIAQPDHYIVKEASKEVAEQAEEYVDKTLRQSMRRSNQLGRKQLSQYEGNKKELIKDLELYNFYRHLNQDYASVTKDSEVDYSEFLKWLRVEFRYRARDLNNEGIHTIDELFERLRPDFMQWRAKYRKGFLKRTWQRVADRERHEEVVKFIDDLQSMSQTDYNRNVAVKLAEIEDFAEFESRFIQMTTAYHSYDDNLQLHGFFSHLIKEDLFTQHNFLKVKRSEPNLSLGELMRRYYEEFAPYAKGIEQQRVFNPLRWTSYKNIVKDQALSIKACASNPRCYINNLSRAIKDLVHYKHFFGYLSKNSCIGRSKKLRNIFIADVGISWAMMGGVYLIDRISGVNKLDRPAWELIARDLIFAGWLAEQFCLSFKKPKYSMTDPFGSAQAMRQVRMGQNAYHTTSIAFKAGVTAAAFVGFTYAFDEFYESVLGKPLPHRANFTDQVKTFPFMALYYSGWLNVLNRTVVIPFRSGTLPIWMNKLRKLLPFSPRVLETGGDLAFKSAYELAANFGLLVGYREMLIPWIYDKLGVEFRVNRFNETQVHLTAAQTHTSRDPNDPNIEIIVNTLKDGSTSVVRVRHSIKDGKKMVQILDMDLDLSDEARLELEALISNIEKTNQAKSDSKSQ